VNLRAQELVYSNPSKLERLPFVFVFASLQRRELIRVETRKGGAAGALMAALWTKFRGGFEASETQLALAGSSPHAFQNYGQMSTSATRGQAETGI
jgi:hypothetical protein